MRYEMTKQIKGLTELKMAGELQAPYGSQCTFLFFLQVFRKRLLKRVREKPNSSGAPWPHSKFQGRLQCFVSGYVKSLSRWIDLTLGSPSMFLIKHPRKAQQYLQVNLFCKGLNFACIETLSSLFILGKLMSDILVRIYI